MKGLPTYTEVDEYKDLAANHTLIQLNREIQATTTWKALVVESCPLSLPHQQNVILAAHNMVFYSAQFFLIDTEICGTQIKFPYVPYGEQKIYMESVIKACENSQNALLESPTGTGKTLSLLCSSLGWLADRNKGVPAKPCSKILYLSRTHSQLAQVVKELKKTAYQPIAITLGSRDQMCIHEDLARVKGGQLNIMCKRKRRNRECPYYEKRWVTLPTKKRELMDIEDICAFGKAEGACPFYMVRNAIPTAELLLLPYNYLLDPKIRTMYRDISFEDSIIIFDEAHNVAKVAEDASSFETSVAMLNKCLDDIKNLEKYKQEIQTKPEQYDDIKKEMSQITLSELAEIAQPIQAFIAYLQDFPDPGKDGTVMGGRKLFNMFKEGTAYKVATKNEAITKYVKKEATLENEQYMNGITVDNSSLYMASLNKCTDALAARNGGSYLLEWYRIIETVYYYMRHDSGPASQANQTGSIEDFKVVVSNEEESEKDSSNEGSNRSLKVFCFNPGIGFIELLRAVPRSIILTSGTLSPMDTLEKELRIPFPIKLESKHVIDISQVSLNVISSTESGHAFNFTYQHRENEAQLKALGEFIKKTCIVTPGGVLVFFSSYSVLNKCWALWKKTIIQELTQIYGIRSFREERGAAANQKTLCSYRHVISKGKGAVLYSVCRGKISEGLDFSDEAARAVIVVGIPFPAQTDKRVVLKKEYLDRKAAELKMNGGIWYTQEAIRAVNQAIGRVIRHINDYGAIILVDQRYAIERMSGMLSKWLREIPCPPLTTAKCAERLEVFFKEQGERKAIEVAPLENMDEEIKDKAASTTKMAFDTLDQFMYKPKYNPPAKKRISTYTKITDYMKKPKTEHGNPEEEIKVPQSVPQLEKLPRIVAEKKQEVLTSGSFGLKAASESVNFAFKAPQEAKKDKENKFELFLRSELSKKAFEDMLNLIKKYKTGSKMEIEVFVGKIIEVLQELATDEQKRKVAMKVGVGVRKEEREIYNNLINGILGKSPSTQFASRSFQIS
eukprot:TRINITY_DN926_c8_g1_i1.p2 TRINITY_DN926_c8_g1~~TRINITY_DN926_c8_g1_i1.p2  ORF type:complete len:1015 (-),score=128.69 TRINITY_DN926_c8_g1_i1:3623-6667(-)